MQSILVVSKESLRGELSVWETVVVKLFCPFKVFMCTFNDYCEKAVDGNGYIDLH